MRTSIAVFAMRWVASIVVDKWPDLDGWALTCRADGDLLRVRVSLRKGDHDGWGFSVPFEAYHRRDVMRVERMVETLARRAQRGGHFEAAP